MASQVDIAARVGEVVRATIVVGTAAEWYSQPTDVGSATGDLEVISGLTINRVRWSGGDLTFNRSGAGMFGDYFDVGQPGRDKFIFIATDGGEVAIGNAIDIDAVGGGFVRWMPPSAIGTILDTVAAGESVGLVIADNALVPNAPPTVTIDTPGSTIGTGEDVDLAATAADVDGSIAVYAWTATGGSFDDAAIEGPTWTAPAVAGMYELTLTVTDDDGATASASVIFTVQAQAAGYGRLGVQLDVDLDGNGAFGGSGEDVTGDMLLDTGIVTYRGLRGGTRHHRAAYGDAVHRGQ